MRVLQSTPSFQRTLASKNAQIKEYGLEHTVELQWGISKDADSQGIFKMVIDHDTVLYLDVEELLSYLRVI